MKAPNNTFDTSNALMVPLKGPKELACTRAPAELTGVTKSMLKTPGRGVKEFRSYRAKTQSVGKKSAL